MIDTSIVPADESSIAEAARLIRIGKLVAFPTETVYGLGADATQEDAVARIFAAKGRPHFNPLIVHVPNVTTARRYGVLNDRAEAVAAAFWPGALTLVVPRATDSGLSHLVSAGLDTVALRVPDHPIGHALLKAAERPIAAPSANRSGAVSPTTARHVFQSLPTAADGGPTLILDDGPCRVGLESTVVDCTTDTVTLLRPGGVTAEDIANIVGSLTEGDDRTSSPRSPGMLESHYAPTTPLRLDANTAEDGAVLIGFGPAVSCRLNLSPTGDLIEAAANLFALLHTADAEGHTCIAVMPIPDHGLGRAINDRLRRAAHR